MPLNAMKSFGQSLKTSTTSALGNAGSRVVAAVGTSLEKPAVLALDHLSVSDRDRAHYQTISDGARDAIFSQSPEILHNDAYGATLKQLKASKPKAPGRNASASEKTAHRQKASDHESLTKSAEHLQKHAEALIKAQRKLKTSVEELRSFGRSNEDEVAALFARKAQLRSENVTGPVPEHLRQSTIDDHHTLDQRLIEGQSVALLKHELKSKIAEYPHRPTASLRSLVKRHRELEDLGYADAGRRFNEIRIGVQTRIAHAQGLLQQVRTQLEAGIPPAAVEPIRSLLERSIAKLDAGLTQADELATAERPSPFQGHPALRDETSRLGEELAELPAA